MNKDKINKMFKIQTEITTDYEKQNDFILSKKDFLKSYSYLTEKDYKKMVEDLQRCLVVLDNCGMLYDYEFEGIMERINNKLKEKKE